MKNEQVSRMRFIKIDAHARVLCIVMNKNGGFWCAVRLLQLTETR